MVPFYTYISWYDIGSLPAPAWLSSHASFQCETQSRSRECTLMTLPTWSIFQQISGRKKKESAGSRSLTSYSLTSVFKAERRSNVVLSGMTPRVAYAKRTTFKKGQYHFFNW